jgi:hypothetical protein
MAAARPFDAGIIDPFKQTNLTPEICMVGCYKHISLVLITALNVTFDNHL